LIKTIFHWLRHCVHRWNQSPKRI